MTEWDRYLRDAAALLAERHGDDARAFAQERLDFCLDTEFIDGIRLWRGMLDWLPAAPNDVPPAPRQP